MRVRFSIRGLMVAVAVAAGLAGSSRLGPPMLLLAAWIGLAGLMLRGGFRYDRESPEGNKGLLLLLGLATSAVVIFTLLQPLLITLRGLP